MPLLKILYISYDGIGDPLGRSQVLPYIKKLTKKDIEIFLLSFEKEISGKTGLNSFGINWIPLRYHKGGILMKALDAMAGIWLAALTLRKEKIRIIHCRGYFSAFIAFCLKAILPVSYIFDMRGLWVDEKVDGGSLSKGDFKYHVAKYIEKRLLLSADKIIVLTYAMKRRLAQLSYLKEKTRTIIVVATCADLESFYPVKCLNMPDNPLKGGFVVSYSGSIGTFYNFSAALDFYKILSHNMKDSRLLVMSNAPVSLIRQIILDKGIPSDKFYLDSVLHEDMPRWLNLSDVSLIFYNRKYSKEGCCPTKFGESLACGVPVIINDGIGDCSDIVKEKNIGVVIEDFTERSYTKAIKELYGLLEDREGLRDRCRRAAEELFALDRGVEKYLEIYNSLA